MRSTKPKDHPQDSTGGTTSQAELKALGEKDSIQEEIQQLENEKL